MIQSAIPKSCIHEAQELFIKHGIVNSMKPCVYRILLNGKLTFGVNYHPIHRKVGDEFHYDYGGGSGKNSDAKIAWIPN